MLWAWGEPGGPSYLLVTLPWLGVGQGHAVKSVHPLPAILESGQVLALCNGTVRDGDTLKDPGACRKWGRPLAFILALSQVYFPIVPVLPISLEIF